MNKHEIFDDLIFCPSCGQEMVPWDASIYECEECEECGEYFELEGVDVD